MTLQEIMKEVQSLSDKELDKLKVLLEIEKDMRSPEFQAMVTRKINDKDPAHWMTLEEAEKRLFGSKAARRRRS